MDWFTNVEIGIWAKAAAFSLGATEIVKRVSRAAGHDMSSLAIWGLSMLLTGIVAYMLLLTIPVALLTNPIWFLVCIMAFSTPVSHYIIINNGAKFVQFMVKKYTGYEMNLTDVVKGHSYKLHANKVIKTAEGEEKTVPQDYQTDHKRGDRTLYYNPDETQPRDDAEERER